MNIYPGNTVNQVRRVLLSFVFFAHFVVTSFAQQGLIHSFTAEIRKPESTFALTETERTTPTMRAMVQANGIPFSGVTNGWKAVLFYGNNAGSVTITNTAIGASWFDFTPTQSQIGTNGTFAAQLLLYGNSGSIQEWARGTIVLLCNPVASNVPFAWSNANTWATWEQINAATSGLARGASVGGTNYFSIGGIISLPAIAGPPGAPGAAGTNGATGPAGPANYGITATNSYRGDWGAAVSAQVVTATASAANANTVASNAVNAAASTNIANAAIGAWALSGTDTVTYAYALRSIAYPDTSALAIGNVDYPNEIVYADTGGVIRIVALCDDVTNIVTAMAPGLSVSYATTAGSAGSATTAGTVTGAQSNLIATALQRTGDTATGNISGPDAVATNDFMTYQQGLSLLGGRSLWYLRGAMDTQATWAHLTSTTPPTTNWSITMSNVSAGDYGPSWIVTNLSGVAIKDGVINVSGIGSSFNTGAGRSASLKFEAYLTNLVSGGSMPEWSDLGSIKVLTGTADYLPMTIAVSIPTNLPTGAALVVKAKCTAANNTPTITLVGGSNGQSSVSIPTGVDLNVVPKSSSGSNVVTSAGYYDISSEIYKARTALQPNAVNGTDPVGTIVANGLVTTVGSATPWTGLGYVTRTVTNGLLAANGDGSGLTGITARQISGGILTNGNLTVGYSNNMIYFNIPLSSCTGIVFNIGGSNVLMKQVNP